MDYRENQNRKTTADVFFQNASRKPEKGCEAWINADGTLYQVCLDGVFCEPDELKSRGVSAVDYFTKTTVYL